MRKEAQQPMDRLRNLFGADAVDDAFSNVGSHPRIVCRPDRDARGRELISGRLLNEIVVVSFGD